jgi:hypothetical protein
MKHDEQVDEFFRNGFNPDFSEEIPHDFMADINQKLDQLAQNKRKKRVPIYWWVAGVFSLAGLILLAYSFTQSQEIKPNAQIKNRSLKEEDLTSTSKQPSQVNRGIAMNHGQANSMDSEGNSMSSLDFSNPDSQVSSEITGFSQNSNRIISNVLEENKSNKAIRDLVEMEVKQTIQTDSSFQTIQSSKMLTELEKKTEVTMSPDQISTQNTHTIQVDSNEIPKIKETAVPSSTSEFLKANDSLKLNNKRIGYSLSFYSGVSGIFHKVLAPNSSFGSFSSTNSITPEDYRNKRKMEEKSLTSWDMAIRVGMNYKRVNFSTGIDYFVWGERTYYSNVNYNAQYQNMYRFLNIPLLLGYEFQKGSFGIQPSLGFSLGFLAREVFGYYLNVDNISSSYQADISKRIATFHSGVEFSYFSQSGIKVSVSPVFRKSLTPVVKSELARNSYSSLGLQLGIGYRW